MASARLFFVDFGMKAVTSEAVVLVTFSSTGIHYTGVPLIVSRHTTAVSH